MDEVVPGSWPPPLASGAAKAQIAEKDTTAAMWRDLRRCGRAVMKGFAESYRRPAGGCCRSVSSWGSNGGRGGAAARNDAGRHFPTAHRVNSGLGFPVIFPNHVHPRTSQGL